MSRFELPRRGHPWFGWLLRAVLLALALALGGVVHGAADLLVAAGVLAEEHEQCPPDGACNDCVAGCPNCHCGGLRTVAPNGGLPLGLASAEPDLALLSRGVSDARLGPTLDSLYRPPRRLARVHDIG